MQDLHVRPTGTFLQRPGGSLVLIKNVRRLKMFEFDGLQRGAEGQGWRMDSRRVISGNAVTTNSTVRYLLGAL